jgi:hypothetical protein
MSNEKLLRKRAFNFGVTKENSTLALSKQER